MREAPPRTEMNVYGASSAQSTLAHTRLRPFETCVVVVGSMLAKGNQGTALWSKTAKNTDCSTGPLTRPFACTAHSFAFSTLLASLTRSAALTRLLAHSITPTLMGK